MAKIRHITDGQNLGEPRNWKELEIAWDFLQEKQFGEIKTTQLEFVGKQHKYLRERILDGMNGGVGIFEGIPYVIEVGSEGNPVFRFNGYIDGASDTNFIGNEEIIADLKKEGGEDWLNEVADGFSFAYLRSIGEITNANYKKVPYVINYVPEGLQVMILSMSLYMLTKEIAENTRELSELIGQTVNAATPALGTAIGVPPAPVIAWDLGDWIMYAAYVVAKIIYIIAITIAIVKLIEAFIEQLFPKMRNHLGMSVYDLFDKGCTHLGLTLQSDLLTEIKDWIYIPQKDRKGGESGEYGHPGNSDNIYTFGDCIRVFKQVLNADFRIIDGVFRFERRDYWQVSSGYILPDIFNNQERLLNEWKANTSEFSANYNIHWTLDVQDQNTLDDTAGLTFQVITKPNTVVNKKMVNMKGLTEITIPFALGKRKDNYTFLEKYARGVFQVVDSITGIFGSGTNFANKIEARAGALLLSSHFISVGKIVKMSGGKLDTDQRGKLAAKTFWDKWHYINSFAEINGVHNQWKRYPALKLPLTEEDLSIIINNNFINSPDGRRAMIETITWETYKDTATIEYRINEKYTNNLHLEYVE